MGEDKMLDYGPIHLFSYELDDAASQFILRPISRLAHEALDKMPNLVVPQGRKPGPLTKAEVTRILGHTAGIRIAAPNTVFVHVNDVSDVLKIKPGLFCQFLSELTFYETPTESHLYVDHPITESHLLVEWCDNGVVKIDEIAVDQIWHSPESTTIINFRHLCADEIWIDPKKQKRPSGDIDVANFYMEFLNESRARPIKALERGNPPHSFVSGSEKDLIATGTMMLEALQVAHGHAEKKVELTFTWSTTGKIEFSLVDVQGSGFDLEEIPISREMIQAFSLIAQENKVVHEFDRQDKVLCGRTWWDKSYTFNVITADACSSNHQVIERSSQINKTKAWLEIRGFERSKLNSLFPQH